MRILKLIIVFLNCLIICLLSLSTPGCKNPEEFKPEFDSLIPPPGPPSLLYPPDDTTFWLEQWNPKPDSVELQWSSVEGAQYYELQIANDTLFRVDKVQVYKNSYIFILSDTGQYFWRVRAYNRAWEWYTAWSEIWSFYCRENP